MPNRVNILMIDDQPGKLLSYEAILGELGENLIKAHSPNEALEILLKVEVAVALMDVSMPGVSGFELADMIREHPRFTNLAIIFISAVHLTDLDRIKAYERGAADYISVPIIPELLRAKVKVFIDLYRKTRQLEFLNHKLRRLSGSVIASQDQERRRIARELHDSLGQEITAAKMVADGIRLRPAESKDSAAEEVSALLDHALQQVRSISYLLHPPLLDVAGLRSALKEYVKGFAERSGILTLIDVQPPEFPRLAPDLETTVFRIVQEALTNVFRHSGARNSSVSVLLLEGQISLKILDDGKGMPHFSGRSSAGAVGVGLEGMRQRAKEFGGELRVSDANPGTLVQVVIPTDSAPQRSPASG